MTEKFNPAFYVSFSADGEKELDLVAKMLWFQHAYPGWRIVSDGMDVFTFRDQDDIPVTILLGHVAAINQEGIRVSSVPASVTVSDSLGECAQDFFEIGASTLLDMLGMNVYNITSEQWSEFWRFKNNREYGNTETPVQKPVKKIQILQQSFEPSRQARQKEGDDGITVIKQKLGPEKLSREETPQYQPIEKAPPEDTANIAISEENVMAIFADIVVRAPREVPSYSPGTPVDEEQLQKLFDRFCLEFTGASWDIADEVERGQIMDRMMKILENATK